MTLLSLAWHSLRSRKLALSLTALSIALSVALLLGIESVRTAARESFSSTVSGVDLIVGARSGSLQLLLYTVFRLGSPTNNIRYETYEKWKAHPAVAWTIPYSLGDSHRGFRVVGTTKDFYDNYRFRRDRRVTFRAGAPPRQVLEVVLGSDVADALGYQLDTKVAITHGISHARGIMDHDDKPFAVSGILERTATPIDRSLYIPLEGMTEIHADWGDGAPGMPGAEAPAPAGDGHKIEQITAFLLRTRSRIDTLRLQREINTYAAEPLLAIIPGVALNEMWQTIGYIEGALTVISWFVLVVGLLGMVVAIYTSLNERRREIAVLRSIGLGREHVFFLMVLESGLLGLLGIGLGIGLLYLSLAILQPAVESRFGLYLPIQALNSRSWTYLAVIAVAAFVIGLVPAWKAYRNSLSDGLAARL